MAHAQVDCGEWTATVEKVVGRIEVRRAGQTLWMPLDEGDRVCLDEPVRSARDSSALLRLPDETEFALGENTGVTFGRPEDENRTWVDVLRGMILIFSRDPRDLRITTPYANAGLEGTEFQIAVTDDVLDLTVFEGVVDLESLAGGGMLSVASGQAVTVRAGQYDEIRPASPMQTELLWALHYPRVLDGPLPALDEPPADRSADAGFFARRAQSRMSAGRIAAARADIDAALAIAADDPEALAVEVIILLAEGEPDAARERIERALARVPVPPAALIAQTYLLVYDNALRPALDAAGLAVERAPGSAVAHARLAEVRFAVGAVPAAIDSANTALALDPASAPAQSVLGFAALAEGRVDAAAAYFREAARLDSAAAIPRLGLAIAMIRMGQAVEGRDQLEIALALDPNDATLRAYLGKAYFDELRTGLAAAQFELAKRLDREDPTAYLYSAGLERAGNRPIPALEELSAAAAVNGNRAVFRSRFLLDEDLVARSTSLGEVYREIGFEELALRAASRTIVLEPSDYSAHRLLSDVYSVKPRYQLTRVSEAYQARMLQPLNVVPSPPQLALFNLLIMDSAGPAGSLNPDPRSSFARNGIDVQTSAVAGGNSTRGENVVVSGLGDTVSFNLGQFGYETDGFRPNNDLDHEVVSLFVQGRLSSTTSLQGELRSSKTEKGDLRLLFDPDNYDDTLRQIDEDDRVQLGFSRTLSPWSVVLGSLTLGRADLAFDTGDVFSADISLDRGNLELQYINERPSWKLVGGLRAGRAELDERTAVLGPLPGAPLPVVATNFAAHSDRVRSAYLYAHHNFGESLQLTAGASFDRLSGRFLDIEQTSPKLGFSWVPGPDTSVRVALYRTLHGSGISKQVILPSLEPTQVTGFGQIFFGAEGEDARNYAIGANHAFTPKFRIGFEHLERSVDSPFLFSEPGSPELFPETFNIRESVDWANLYWTPTPDLALRAGWQYEHFDYHGEVSPFLFTELRTTRAHVAATRFLGDRFSLRFTGTRIHQRGIFDQLGPVENLQPGDSRFWVADAALSYRLPKRLGTVELGINNLFDESFLFQDTDPENPHVFPERLAFARFTVTFSP